MSILSLVNMTPAKDMPPFHIGKMYRSDKKLGIYTASNVFSHNDEICIDFSADSPHCFSKKVAISQMDNLKMAIVRDRKMWCWTIHDRPYFNINTGERMDIAAFCLTPQQVDTAKRLASR